MRLITRADLDGLTCAVLLSQVETIDDVMLAHPKDVQDGKVDITSNDVLANLPHDPRAGMIFDHHASQRLGSGESYQHAAIVAELTFGLADTGVDAIEVRERTALQLAPSHPHAEGAAAPGPVGLAEGVIDRVGDGAACPRQLP